MERLSSACAALRVTVTVGSGRRAARRRDVPTLFPTPLPTSPCVPQDERRPPEASCRESRDRPARGRSARPRGHRTPAGLEQGRAGDDAAPAPHAPPLPRFPSPAPARARPELRPSHARSWAGRVRPAETPGPTCAVGRSAPGTPARHRAACCRGRRRETGEGPEPRGGAFLRARTRFLSSPGPLHARRPSRLPDRRAQKVWLFAWAKPRGEVRWGRRFPGPGEERMEKRGTPSRQVR